MKSKPKNDFLKYWRVARNFMRVRYNLSDPDLDMLLFLYSEEYFTRDTYKEYAKLFSWQINRFYRLIDEGWIENHQKKQKLTKALYGTTYKTTRVIGSLYKKLNGEPYPE
jgi:CDP-diacylglycerol pyrophosphatase